jgi:hypothetical protein
MNLCKYRDSLGVPNQGLHSHRFMGLAIMDVIFTIIGAMIISYFSKYSSRVEKLIFSN